MPLHRQLHSIARPTRSSGSNTTSNKKQQQHAAAALQQHRHRVQAQRLPAKSLKKKMWPCLEQLCLGCYQISVHFGCPGLSPKVFEFFRTPCCNFYNPNAAMKIRREQTQVPLSCKISRPRVSLLLRAIFWFSHLLVCECSRALESSTRFNTHLTQCHRGLRCKARGGLAHKFARVLQRAWTAGGIASKIHLRRRGDVVAGLKRGSARSWRCEV
jgi:hypothetical protein